MGRDHAVFVEQHSQPSRSFKIWEQLLRHVTVAAAVLAGPPILQTSVPTNVLQFQRSVQCFYSCDLACTVLIMGMTDGVSPKQLPLVLIVIVIDAAMPHQACACQNCRLRFQVAELLDHLKLKLTLSKHQGTSRPMHMNAERLVNE